MINVPMTPVPAGATDEKRHEMFLEWCDKLVAANSNFFLPLGVTKRWWMLFKHENPRTKYLDKHIERKQ